MAASTILNITAVTAGALAAIQALQARLNGLTTVGTSPSFAPMLAGLAAVTAAVAGVVAVAGGMSVALSKGLAINADLEDTTNGIKSLIYTMTEIRDAGGQLAAGPEKMAIAGELAAGQMQKLRIAALQTSATVAQLSGAYQSAIGAGSAAGISLDNTLKLTVGITQAAAALKVPMDQLNQEVRSILAGQITADSTVGNSLKAKGITNEQLKLWREAGVLGEKLLDVFKDYDELSKVASLSYSNSLGQISEVFTVAIGDTTKKAYDTIKGALAQAAQGLFTPGSMQIAGDLKGLADFAESAFSTMGTFIASAIGAAIDVLRDVSAWLDRNHGSLEDVGEAALQFGSALLTALTPLKVIGVLLYDILGWIDELIIKTGLLSTATRGFAYLIALVQDGFALMGVGCQKLGVLIIDYLVAPVRGLVKTLGGLYSAIPGVGKSLAAAMDGVANTMPESGERMQAAAEKTLAALRNGEGAVGKLKTAFYGAALAPGTPDNKPKISGTSAPIVDTSGAEKAAKAAADKAAKAAARAAAKAAREDSQLRQAEQALVDAQAEAAKKRAAAARETAQTQLEAELDGHLITYGQYLDRKSALESGAIAADLAAERDKRAKLIENMKVEPNAAKKVKLEADLTKVDSEIATLEQREVTVQAKLVLEKAQLDRDIASLKIDIRANILDSQGNTLEASLLKLAQETDALLQDRRVKGDAELQDLVRKQASQRENQLRFDDSGKQASMLQAQLASQEAEVARQVSAGQLTQLDADGRILEARKATAAAMWGSVEAAKALAAASGNPQLVQSAAELEAKYKELSTTLNTTSVALNESFFGALKSGFQDLISGAKSFGDVMKNIISSVLSKLAELAINQAFGSLMGGMGGLGGGIGGLFSSVFGFADGGAVRGPGTGTSDSILAKLSNGEFVLKAAAVRALGVDRLNYANKYGKLPGFAGDGLAGSAGGAGAGGLLAGLMQREATTVNNEISVSPNITLHSGKISQALFADSGFRREVLVLVGESGKKIKSAWG